MNIQDTYIIDKRTIIPWKSATVHKSAFFFKQTVNEVRSYLFLVFPYIFQRELLLLMQNYLLWKIQKDANAIYSISLWTFLNLVILFKVNQKNYPKSQLPVKSPNWPFSKVLSLDSKCMFRTLKDSLWCSADGKKEPWRIFIWSGKISSLEGLFISQPSLACACVVSLSPPNQQRFLPANGSITIIFSTMKSIFFVLPTLH